MATTLTTNLKLRISDLLTADSKYNLQRLDSLGSIYQVDTNQAANIRSQTSINLLPNSTDIGGTGSGGSVTIGTADQPADSFTIYASSFSTSGPLKLADQATGGDKDLLLKYKSDVSGAVDTTADRTLNFDLEGGDRNLTLGGDLTIGSNSLILNMPISTSWTLPGDTGTAGQFLSTDGAGLLSWTSETDTLEALTDTTITSPASGEILIYNGSAWVNQASAVSIQQTTAAWITADGTSKTVTHNFGTRNVMVQVLDSADNYRTIEVDSVTRPTDNTVLLSSPSAPSSSWTVLVTTVG